MWNLKGFSPDQFREKSFPSQFRVRLMGTLKTFINNSVQEIIKVWLQIWLQTKTTTSNKKIIMATCPLGLGFFMMYKLIKLLTKPIPLGNSLTFLIQNNSNCTNSSSRAPLAKCPFFKDFLLFLLSLGEKITKRKQKSLFFFLERNISNFDLAICIYRQKNPILK